MDGSNSKFVKSIGVVAASQKSVHLRIVPVQVSVGSVWRNLVAEGARPERQISSRSKSGVFEQSRSRLSGRLLGPKHKSQQKIVTSEGLCQ